jgi:hypothetical protein
MLMATGLSLREVHITVLSLGQGFFRLVSIFLPRSGIPHSMPAEYPSRPWSFGEKRRYATMIRTEGTLHSIGDLRKVLSPRKREEYVTVDSGINGSRAIAARLKDSPLN